MAQQNLGGGLPPNFLANLPVVPQNSVTCHGTKNLLEGLIAIVVPPKYSTPTPGHQGSSF